VARQTDPETVIRSQVVLEEHDLAPDGRFAVAVRRFVQGDRYRSHLWLVPLDGTGRPIQLTSGGVRDSSPRVSPDGSAVAFRQPSRPPGCVTRRSARASPMAIPHGCGLGKIVEIGPAERVISVPRHSYTAALVSVAPSPEPPAPGERARRTILVGETPDASAIPTGCRFRTRCPLAFDRCAVEEPPLIDVGGGQAAACWLAETGAPTALATG
jgi:oligopeptide/dipeptide ABC transporter ATP-binding protein